MGKLQRALTHRSPLRRALASSGIALVLWLGAWTISYLTIGEGALREAMASRVPDGVLEANSSLALTIFQWNLVFGVGAIVASSLVAIGPISLGYFAPWWWALGYGVALGTNSFVLTVPGKLAPNLGILWQHIGAREILAYILVSAALANIHRFRPLRWRDMKLHRVRMVSDIRLGVTEIALVGGALVLLFWTANVEAAGVIAFLK